MEGPLPLRPAFVGLVVLLLSGLLYARPASADVDPAAAAHEHALDPVIHADPAASAETPAAAAEPATLHAPELTATFTQTLLDGGEAITFPRWCHRVQGGPKGGAPVPIPCRPALFGAAQFSTSADASAFVVVPFADDGCAAANRPAAGDRTSPSSSRAFEGAFALIKRGTCAFVTKALAAQAAGAAGVLISDYPIPPSGPSKKQRTQLTGKRASAESGVMLMWAEKSDKALAEEVTIPVLSVRHEDMADVYETDVAGGNAAAVGAFSLSVEYTEDYRGVIGYVGAVDLLHRHPPEKDDKLRPILFMNIGKAAEALKAYSVSETFLREAVHAWPHKALEALPTLRRLGLLLVGHTDDRDKWTEALGTLRGDKGYKCSIAEVIMDRVREGRLPSFIESVDAALEMVWEMLRQAEHIQGGKETPRVWLDQALCMNLKRDVGRGEKFKYKPGMVRYMLEKASTASFAYNNEKVYGRILEALTEFDKAYPFYSPKWTSRFKRWKGMWRRAKRAMLWPFRKIGLVAEEEKAVYGAFASINKYAKDVGEVDPNFKAMTPGEIMERFTKDIF
jgi:hypothetical protein